MDNGHTLPATYTKNDQVTAPKVLKSVRNGSKEVFNTQIVSLCSTSAWCNIIYSFKSFFALITNITDSSSIVPMLKCPSVAKMKNQFKNSSNYRSP